MKKFLKFLEKRPVVLLILLSLILTLFVEALSRKSLVSTFAHTFQHPIIMAYNCIIILFTLSISLYFSKKYSILALVSFLWIALGIVNRILLSVRGMPLSASDFASIKPALGMVNLYISTPMLVLIIIGVIAVIVGIVCLFIKTPKKRPTYKTASILSGICAGLIVLTSNTLITPEKIVSGEYEIFKIYSKYGFACCFTNTLLNNGISKPDDYSENAVHMMIDEIGYEETYQTDQRKPNVLVIQLETFFDPNYIDIEGLTFSEDPIPTFRALKENYPHGFLKVPSYGGGTANTEFEVLTQTDIRHFGISQCPYSLVLKDQPYESLAHYMKKNGYSAHSMHNHDAVFYSRNVVYQNLGFDTFTPVEHMTDLERNPTNWAKDNIFERLIFDALESTPDKDFVFTVTVQGHGKYPEEVDYELPISVTGIEDEKIKTNLEYYLSQINEMDTTINNLLTKLSQYPEETVVVLYGDHLPNLSLSKLTNNTLGYYPVSCDRYSTEYVIWSNFDLDVEGGDITSYQLGSKVLDSVGIHTGVMTQINLNPDLTEEKRSEYSKLYAYDMLYGKAYLNNIDAVSPTQMRFGIHDITLGSALLSDGVAKIYGTDFNKYSIVLIDDEECETTYISSAELQVPADKLVPGAKVVVGQKNVGQFLTYSNEITF